MAWWQRLCIWLYRTWPVQWFVQEVLPRLKVSWLNRKIPRWVVNTGQLVIEPNDIILTISPFGLGSLLTPGWDHAARCLKKTPTPDSFLRNGRTSSPIRILSKCMLIHSKSQGEHGSFSSPSGRKNYNCKRLASSKRQCYHP